MKDRKTVTPMISIDPNAASATRRGRGPGALGPEIQAKIGKQLRAYYGGLIEPTPERFVALLQRLEKPDQGSDKDEGSDK
jgi:hypothetical protein